MTAKENNLHMLFKVFFFFYPCTPVTQKCPLRESVLGHGEQDEVCPEIFNSVLLIEKAENKQYVTNRYTAEFSMQTLR